MPRQYDPQRYVRPTESGAPALQTPRPVPAAPSPSEVLAETISLMISPPTSRLLGGGVEHSCSLAPKQVASYDQLSHVRLTLPEDVLTALAGLGSDVPLPDWIRSRHPPPSEGTPGTNVPRKKGKNNYIHRYHHHHHHHHCCCATPCPTTSPLSTTAITAVSTPVALALSDLAPAGSERGRARQRRSLSWHHRERLPTSAGGPTRSLRQSCDDAAGPRNRGDAKGRKWGMDRGAAAAAAATVRGVGRGAGATVVAEGRGVETGRKTGESIDAEQLFRRKKKLTYNVTYGGWAEGYDRLRAKHAMLERRERLEMEREESRRRQKAKDEFQKWRRNHARPASASAILSTRSCSEGPDFPARRDQRKGGGTDGEGRGGRKEEEERRREIDRSFRRWLGRKKRQARNEREAKERNEELLRERRELEASRRWKKRPVVCAYTYGAQIGARQWSQEGEQKGEEGAGGKGGEREDRKGAGAQTEMGERPQTETGEGRGKGKGGATRRDASD